MKRTLYIVILLSTLVIPNTSAYYPSLKLNFENIKMKRSERQALELELLKYLKESPEVLKTQGKRYKEDQRCRYELDTKLNTETGEQVIDLDTIKVLDKKKNLSYNLKIIEFLRLHPEIKIEKRDSEKPVEIEFKYLAF